MEADVTEFKVGNGVFQVFVLYCQQHYLGGSPLTRV